jgi:hypothetical protein
LKEIFHLKKNMENPMELLLDDSASSESKGFSDSLDAVDTLTPKERRQAALRELKREREGGGALSQRKRERRERERRVVSSDDGSSEEQGIISDGIEKVGGRGLGGVSRLVQCQNRYNYSDYVHGDEEGDEDDLGDFIASDSEDLCYNVDSDVDVVHTTPNKKKKRGKTKKVVVLESSDDGSLGGTDGEQKPSSTDASSSSYSLEEEDLDLSLKNAAAMVVCNTASQHGRLKKNKKEHTKSVGQNIDTRSGAVKKKQHDALSPAERIREAQRRVLQDDDDNDTSSGSEDPVSQLTDEGDPGTTESSGSPSSNDTYESSEHDEQKVVRDDSVWREEVSKIGIHRMTEEDAFKAYIEYLFICSLDPSYESQVKRSASHRMLYTQSIQKIEYLIIQAQNCVQSEAWRSCEPYLLESMEQHALFHEIAAETGKGSQESSGLCDEFQCEQQQCAACGKPNGSRRVQFLGKHLNNRILAGEKDVDVLLSQKYALASPIYQRNRQYMSGGNGDEDQMEDDVRQFWLGSVCAKRIAIFHSLIHFRYHCMVYLKRRAKSEKMKLESSSSHRVTLNELVDAVLTDSAHARLFSCFESLINVANTYQLKGGKEERMLGIRPQVASAPQDILLGDAGTDVSDIHMDNSSEESSESQPSE